MLSPSNTKQRIINPWGNHKIIIKVINRDQIIVEVIFVWLYNAFQASYLLKYVFISDPLTDLYIYMLPIKHRHGQHT